jgi:hypothetical protein
MRCVALITLLASLAFAGHARRVKVDVSKTVMPDPPSSSDVKSNSQQGPAGFGSKLYSLFLDINPRAAAEIPQEPPVAEKPKEEEIGIGTRILQGASQGAVASVIAAMLAAGVEPIVNRILVQRIGVMESFAQQTMAATAKFFMTTLPTNFLKFPFFEAVNAVCQPMAFPSALKGLLVGVVFTSVTLPITNYRFCKSMNYPVDVNALFKAYLPTVVRDVIYGIARNQTQQMLDAAGMGSGIYGSALTLAIVVLVSCIISSPGNELRGYCLQPPEKRLGFKQFFKPVNYLRSTCMGATIMAISLGGGSIVTSYLKMLFA